MKGRHFCRIFMDFLGSVLKFFTLKMTTPTNYGWFHLLSILVVISATVLLCMKFKDCSEQKVRIIAFVFWAVILTLEIYKQIIYGLSYGEDGFSWDYAWYAFPYQFCSSPLYALPFIAFLREGRVRNAFISFMSFFSLFGGVAVFFYPNDVFISTIGINIQTMIHHGTQIVLGIFFIVHRRRSLSIKGLLDAAYVFLGFCAVAVALNVAVYNVFSAVGIDETFNMFFISPYFDCTLPVLSLFYPMLPYPLFLVLYVVGFLIVGAVIFFASLGVIRLLERRKNGDIEVA